MKLLAERKTFLSGTQSSVLKNNGLETRLEGRDLLTLLVKANMGADLLEHQRLSDEDVIARTFTPFILSLCSMIH